MIELRNLRWGDYPDGTNEIISVLFSERERQRRVRIREGDVMAAAASV